MLANGKLRARAASCIFRGEGLLMLEKTLDRERICGMLVRLGVVRIAHRIGGEQDTRDACYEA